MNFYLCFITHSGGNLYISVSSLWHFQGMFSFVCIDLLKGTEVSSSFDWGTELYQNTAYLEENIIQLHYSHLVYM